MKKLQKEFKNKGYELNRFISSDSERIGPNREIYKYYVSKDGRIVEKFEKKSDARQWIEFRDV